MMLSGQIMKVLTRLLKMKFHSTCLDFTMEVKSFNQTAPEYRFEPRGVSRMPIFKMKRTYPSLDGLVACG